MANQTYHRYKKLSEGLFDPIDDFTSTDACLSDFRRFRRMASKFEKCAALRANYTQKYVPPEKRDQEHKAAIEAARARAAECRELLERLKHSIPAVNAQKTLHQGKNVWEVLETERKAGDKDNGREGDEDDLAAPPVPSSGPEGSLEDTRMQDGWHGEDLAMNENDPSKMEEDVKKTGMNGRQRSTESQSKDDDDATIDGARLAVKLELLWCVSKDVYQACERWKLSFTNEVKYEIVHSLLLYIYGESCIHEAQRKVTTFLESKSFLVSLGFFCIRDLKRGNESVMRKAARMMQRRYGDQVKAMNMKDVFVCVHCMLTLFFG